MQAPMGERRVYVAVHGGAGCHGVASEQSVKSALKRACARALQESRVDDSSALSVVERAISVLEDDECLNAGYGSNLTIDGTVECDAAVMDGLSGDFGSVGAVPGVKNPIKLASAVLRHSRESDPLGRIRPMTLVASGAHSFASSQDIQTVAPNKMISPRATQEWQKWKSRLIRSTNGDQESLPQDAMQDTVGAVAWDNEGNLAAGVSSGGLLLKYSGRIGEAATFGTGCWAQQSRNEHSGMACSISGAGEHIMRGGLAHVLGEALQSPQSNHSEVDTHQVLLRILNQQFTEPLRQRGEQTPNAGVLLLTKEHGEGDEVLPRLWCAFTTDSMAVAYASTAKPSPKVSILRRPASTGSAVDADKSSVYITALPIHR
ncbi:nucleophile aminohydrolase [Suillus paluster]|uniref:nucleophile aminohydrolase n=1 Tax=Suillus paluster TaxID=48578 RepID=UPI001B87567D|nr:nucleophile aminohydrolase [Suillus paluster]KAG1734669.1 nucleophile aminohydrolase [Suillus paluster]